MAYVNTGSSESIEAVKLFEYPEDSLKITDDAHDKVLNHCIARLDSARTAREQRLRRYAGIDRMVTTWQKLSPEDSVRLHREEMTGNPQAIAANLPIADTHIKDSAAFYTEIFAPASGSFYSNQGNPDDVEQVTKLADELDKDMKVSGYYANVASVMRSLCKYNVGGFTQKWASGNPKAVGNDRLEGNRVDVIDVYNFLYDSMLTDVNRIREEAEWCATVKQRNRLWLLRQAEAGFLSYVDEVVADAGETTGVNAKYYKNSPGEAKLNYLGRDETTSFNATGGLEPDWASYGASLASQASTVIAGHEVIDMYIWLNPKQMLMDAKDDSLKLYYVVIVDACYVCHLEEMENAVELPIYYTYLDKDEMLDAYKSLAEAMQPFQRHISFYMNASTAAERGNTWHQRVYNPRVIDPSQIKSGETSGWIPTLKDVADVRTAVMDMTQVADTSRNFQAIQAIFGMQQQLFPTSALPSQVASMDRTTNSQVAAVMMTSHKRMHMQVRALDSALMNPLRMAGFRNYIAYSTHKQDFSQLTEQLVARLLNSGLGQLNREVASTAIQALLFALIQNPDSAAQFDMPLLFTVWSQMLNTGVDLGKLVKNGGAGQQGAIPVPAPQPPGGQVPQGQPQGGPQPSVQ